MKAIVSQIRLQYTDDSTEIVLSIPTSRKEVQANVAELKDILSKGKSLEVAIRQFRKKRSLDANSLAWVLISKIAEVIHSSKEEVYIQMLTRYGQREPQLLSVIAEGAPMIYRATNGHCVEVGESELNGKTFKHLAILIGSSEYDTKQMAVLIDGIISECKLLDIETMSDRELQSLKQAWGRLGNE